MNRYEDILDAWITIEQLSEGSINRKDSMYQLLHEKQADWKKFFEDFLGSQKDKNHMSDKSFQKSGLVMYFGIFNFQEVVDILREKYNIPSTYEEISNSDKFTIALYFDSELNFIPDKLFLTMSGVIRNLGYLPDNFNEIENKFKEVLSRKFEEDFNRTFDELFNRYQISQENFCYKFLSDLENGDVNLHSFFIKDLTKAKTLNNANLNRYIQGFSGTRINLDSHKNSERFNPTIFEEILQPKNFPLGRFISNTEHPPSFMQQVAINLALKDSDSENILSVNGPPGTGKTTLLKDVFADLIVQQAAEIASRPNKKIEPTITYWKQAKFGVLPSSIAEKNIVVASSNNGAVQNIVHELPKMGEDSKEFIEEIKEADYFTTISNCQFEKSFQNQQFNLQVTKVSDDNWGVFSLEGGKATNIEKLLLTIDAMVKDLNNNFLDTPQVYNEFMELHNKVKEEREEKQRIYDNYKRLREVEQQIKKRELQFQTEFQQYEKELNDYVHLNNSKIQSFQLELDDYNATASNIVYEIEQVTLDLKNAERNYDLIIARKPSLFWLQKILFKSKVEKYLHELTKGNQEIQKLISHNNELLARKQRVEFKIEEASNAIEELNKQIQTKQEEFNKWLVLNENKITKLKRERDVLKQELSSKNISCIDFNVSYEDLQNCSPWFDQEFRKSQSKLFILALKVRKQFLYENIKNLKASSIIWNKQSEFVAKENAQHIITEAWQWINFAVPVIGTTFASFSKMFNYVGERSIGYLFIDEAGQALPQASVGGIFRSNKIMVVGDPSQIQPVLTLDSNVLSLIGRNYKVDEKYVSIEASTQTLTDDASRYGFYKSEDEWVGIPLWVHRRCKDPMFTIANTISYNGLMVRGKNDSKLKEEVKAQSKGKEEDESKGKALWIDVGGKAVDKYVKQQGLILRDLISNRIQEDPELANKIYVITPFKNVANQLIKLLDKINFPIREEGKVINIGTVHTFQGKEAKIVYLVLGADAESKGAASWAVSEPNIMNVAATRAKEEFYIIGDKKLYSSLGSKVANDTIKVIEKYNEQIGVIARG